MVEDGQEMLSKNLKKFHLLVSSGPFHPTKKSIEGVKCYRSSFDLPASPDAAFVTVIEKKLYLLSRS